MLPKRKLREPLALVAMMPPMEAVISVGSGARNCLVRAAASRSSSRGDGGAYTGVAGGDFELAESFEGENPASLRNTRAGESGACSGDGNGGCWCGRLRRGLQGPGTRSPGRRLGRRGR